MYQPSEDDLRRFYQRSPVGFYRSTVDGRFLFVNPALVQILGYGSAEEVLALRITDQVYFDPAQRKELIEHYMKLGLVDGVRVRWRHKNGGAVTVRVYGYITEDPSGTTFDATLIDVTELEAAQAALNSKATELETTTAKLHLFLQQMPLLVWTVDRQLTITSFEGSSDSSLGQQRGAHIGKTLQTFLAKDNDACRTAIAKHHEALGGRSVSLDFAHNERQFVISIAPECDADGTVIGCIATAVDVTSSRQLEKRMVEAQRAESLGVLAGGLAHDFNNLLVAILGNADLGLRELPRGASARAPLVNVRDAALRAAELTTQLLAYAGRGDVSTSSVDLPPVVQELLRIMHTSIPDHITVTTTMDDSLPSVRADAGALRQVIMNLISNARDAIASNHGTIDIVAKRMHVNGDWPNQEDGQLVPEPGDYVCLQVTDTGPGMNEQTRRKVFDPFFTTKATGHGLGLASVLGIVRSHGGGLMVTSQLGVGSTFSVLWPIRRSGRISTQPAMGSDAVRGTVLVVDDDEMVRDVLSRMLVDLGYQVLCSHSGVAALEQLAHHDVSLIILDLTMPGLSGAPLVTELRKVKPATPIVVCSGYDRDHKGPLAVEGYLSKPFRLSDLELVLQRFVPDIIAAM
jgi:two-component system, cell cycle sensor histidine kinase and response regulator CckA